MHKHPFTGRLPRIGVGLLLLATALLNASCDDKSQRGSNTPQAQQQPEPKTVEILFSYGSEKKSWIDDVTATFNASAVKVASGSKVHVTAVTAGSGESKDDILAGRTKAHLWSPASAVFVKLGNAESRTRGSDLIGPTQDLVVSPVVIAMWKPMAEALGWPQKPIGWSDIIELSKDPRGWAAHGHAEWGAFKLGHTHPEFSNSGLVSVLAEIYAGAGKQRGLTREDIANPAVAQFVQNVESTIVHYGSSTGFFAERMFSDGPQYLSAAVLYESLVIESYAKNTVSPVVAIYPKEGTFWSDHPVGIVQREWVTSEHKEAAQIYIDYLRAAPQQQKAMQYGFRPADTSIATAAPLDAAHGVDMKEPKTTLEVPGAELVGAAVDLWRSNKKHSSIMLVFDKSGSMQDDNKIINARAGAAELLAMLGDEDALGLVPFSGDIAVIPGGPLKSVRADLAGRINGLLPAGQTRLYEAIHIAYRQIMDHPQPGRISAIVVLTDGEDNGKAVTMEQLLAEIGAGPENAGVRIFTIGYGKDARADVLKRISEKTQAKFYTGKPETIRSVFRDIATFF